MRTIEANEEEGFQPAMRFVDWKATPLEVLQLVDEQLQLLQLEIVTYETGSDCYIWSIEKRNAQ